MGDGITQKAERLAHDAGRAAFSTEPAERRTIDGCPFSEVDHPEERLAWLEGFQAALDEEPDRASLRDQLKTAHAAARKAAS
jgi:ribosome modulation factor